MPSTATAARTRGRDPGGMYPPPPLTRWQITWRYLVVVAAALPTPLAYVMLGLMTPLVPEFAFAFLGLDAVLFVVGIVLIRWRRRWPVVIASVLALTMMASGMSTGLFAWAYISLCTRRRWREQVIPAALFLISTVLAGYLIGPALGLRGVPEDSAFPSTMVGLGFTVLWLIVYTAIGWYVGARRDLLASLRERAETAEREQALQVAQAQSSERARIAREMHDVLAHRISLVSMHAGVLAYRDDLSAEQTKQIALTIQENAHEALTELRGVLSDLRQGPQPEAPQPTLADLPLLINEVRAAGGVVLLDDRLAHPEGLPRGVARHVYRIIQEALTNARKHADGAEIRVRLGGGPQVGVEVEVRNALTHGSGVPGAGLGIVGLRERAQLVGGELAAGPERGDYVVKAWLPWTT